MSLLLAAGAAGAGLSGCGAAVTAGAVTNAAAINGASSMATGKSLQNHGLSAALGKDCQLGRVVEGGALCQPQVGAEGRPGLGDGLAEPARTSVGAVYASVLDSPLVVEAPVIPGNLPTAGLIRYFMLASFHERLDALLAADSVPNLPVKVAAAGTPRDRVFRVLVGPVRTGKDENWYRAQLAAAGITDYRPMNLCAETLREPPCARPTAALTRHKIVVLATPMAGDVALAATP